MTDDLIFSENTLNQSSHIALLQSSLERKKFVKLKERQLFYLVIKLTKTLAFLKASTK